MTVNLVQWRGVIRNFNCSSSAVSYQVCNLTKNFAFIFKVLFYCWHYFESAFLFLSTLVYLFIILQCHWDIEDVRADNPDNIKKGGVCIYYRESLPVQVISLPCFKEALL